MVGEMARVQIERMRCCDLLGQHELMCYVMI